MSSILSTVPTTIPGFPTSSGVPGFPTGGNFTPTPNLGSGGSGFVSSTLGLSSIAGALFEVFAVLVMMAFVGIIIAVVANRADPDPTGRRPQSVYFFVVSFITITTAITGSALVVGSILLLTAHHPSSTDHALTRLLLFSALLTVVSEFLLFVHLRRGLILARADTSPTSPSKRVGQSYVSAVAFVAILVFLVSIVVSIYLLFALAAPTTFGSFGGTGWAVRILVETAYLALVAVFVVWRHSMLLAPGLNIFGGRAVDSSSFGSPTNGMEPPLG